MVLPLPAAIEIAWTCDLIIANEEAAFRLRARLGVAKLAYDLDDAALCDASEVASRKIAKSEDHKQGPRPFIDKRTLSWWAADSRCLHC